MAWNSVSPDGAQSVKANVTIMDQNTTYTEQTMGNIVTQATKDHYWNVDLKSGHHRSVQMENYPSSYTGALASPALSDGMSMALFGLLNSSGTVAVETALKNASGIMQLLGIKAMCVFNVNQGTFAIDRVYSFNVSNLTRSSKGLYNVTFATALPSSNYLALGSGMESLNSASSSVLFGVQGNITLGAAKNTAFLLFNMKRFTVTTGGSAVDCSLVDPLQGWFVCFGG
jgi:hypothetical protein